MSEAVMTLLAILVFLGPLALIEHNKTQIEIAKIQAGCKP